MRRVIYELDRFETGFGQISRLVWPLVNLSLTSFFFFLEIIRNGLLTFVSQVNQDKNIWDVREKFASSMLDGNHRCTSTASVSLQLVVECHRVLGSPMC